MHKKCLLSSIAVGGDAYIAPQVRLTRCGEIAEEHLRMIPGIDQYVIMPNHIHLIIRKGDGQCSSLSQDIKSFKTLVSKRLGYSLWQSSFYDHIIRNESDYLIKSQYIETNPARWIEDELYEE